MIAKGQKISFDEVLKNVTERDRIDSNRKTSPLIKTHDAIEIDNSFLSRKEQFEIVYQLALQKIKNL
jgi:cytidylate kinase